jgi:hypothetical protein
MNNELTDNEVNRIIAEFMSDTQRTYKCKNGKLLVQDYIELKWHDLGFQAYTESLDSLIPVWERLELNCLRDGCNFSSKHNPNLSLIFVNRREGCKQYKFYSTGETIQKAAAMATCKAILKLRSKDD